MKNNPADMPKGNDRKKNDLNTDDSVVNSSPTGEKDANRNAGESGDDDESPFLNQQDLEEDELSGEDEDIDADEDLDSDEDADSDEDLDLDEDADADEDLDLDEDEDEEDEDEDEDEDDEDADEAKPGDKQKII